MTERMEKLEAMLAEDPDSSFLLFAIAKEYEGLGKKDEAQERYQMLMSKDPDYVGLYYHLGKLLESKDQYEEAVHIYSTGMDVAKKIGDKHAYSELSTAHWEASED